MAWFPGRKFQIMRRLAKMLLQVPCAPLLAFVLFDDIHGSILPSPLKPQLVAAFVGEAVGGPGGVPDLFDDDVFDAWDFQ